MTLLLQLSIITNTIYYVDAENGNDNYNGKSAVVDGNTGPWKTLSKVSNTMFQPGEIVRLKKGSIWNEPIWITGQGTSTNPILLTNYGADGDTLPILDGRKYLEDVLGASTASWINIGKDGNNNDRWRMVINTKIWDDTIARRLLLQNGTTNKDYGNDYHRLVYEVSCGVNYGDTIDVYGYCSKNDNWGPSCDPLTGNTACFTFNNPDNLPCREIPSNAVPCGGGCTENPTSCKAKWESCVDGSTDCRALCYNPATKHCYDLQESATAWYSACGANKIFCKPLRPINSIILKTNYDPNQYKVFTNWLRGFTHNNYFYFSNYWGDWITLNGDSTLFEYGDSTNPYLGKRAPFDAWLPTHAGRNCPPYFIDHRPTEYQRVMHYNTSAVNKVLTPVYNFFELGDNQYYMSPHTCPK